MQRQRPASGSRMRRISVSAGFAAAIILLFGWHINDFRVETDAHAAGANDAAKTASATKAMAALAAVEKQAEQDIAAAKAIASLAAVKKRAASADYERARFDPVHFKPAIDFASNEACLVCHQEVMTNKPRAATPAGVKASETLAWYQTLDTYQGNQETFHWRHLQSPFARQVMDLSCNFCHQGNDPREESPHVTARHADGSNASNWRNDAPAFTLRKHVNPSETCLRCHGAFPAENMGLSGSWHENREGLENAEMPNGCLSCHAELFRTMRHQVAYLKAGEIEKLAAKSSDTCFGCHGGRQWYRISYPYPRHAWPNMPEDKPDWASDRPTESEARFKLPAK